MFNCRRAMHSMLPADDAKTLNNKRKKKDDQHRLAAPKEIRDIPEPWIGQNPDGVSVDHFVKWIALHDENLTLKDENKELREKLAIAVRQGSINSSTIPANSTLALRQQTISSVFQEVKPTPVAKNTTSKTPRRTGSRPQLSLDLTIPPKLCEKHRLLCVVLMSGRREWFKTRLPLIAARNKVKKGIIHLVKKSWA